MIIISPREQAGTAGKTGSQFTGDVFPYLTMASTDGVTINTVNFTPCARTYWHSHERGQVIVVLAGHGLIQAQGGEVRVIRAGDTILGSAGRMPLAWGRTRFLRHPHRDLFRCDLVGGAG